MKNNPRSWPRLALAIMLATTLLGQSSLAGAAGGAAGTPAAPVSVENPNANPIVAQWAVTWTTSSRFVFDTESNGGFFRWDYALTQSGSTIVRQYADHTWDNTSFKWHVTSDYTETYYMYNGAWAVCDPDWQYGNSEQTIIDPDRYSAALAHILNVTTQQLPGGTWQASIPFDTLLGVHNAYPFTLYADGYTLECGVKVSKTNSSQYNPSWSTCALSIPATLTGDAQGNDFTYHNQFNGAYTSGLCQYYLTNGSTASQSVDVAVHRLMGTDLIIRRLEVTQALQDDVNSIPLVQGRRTVVRATIGLGESPAAIPNVTGILTGYSGATELGTIAPFNPNQRINASLNPDWMNLNDTLNFELPLAWTTLPELTLKVEVNPNHTIQEANYNNNDLSVDVVTRACKKISIGYVPIHYAPPGGFIPSDPGHNIDVAQAFMQKIYPVPEKGIVYTPLSLVGFEPENINNEDGIDEKLLAALDQALKESSPPRPDHIFGWLPSLAYVHNGLGKMPGAAAYGNDTLAPDMWRRTFAHEIGHNFDLPHPPKDDPLTTAGDHWFDVYDRVIKPVPASVGGNELLDMMVPKRQEPEAWISPTNYLYLMNLLCAAPGAAATSEASPAVLQVGDNLIISGSVSNATPAAGTLAPLVRLSTIAASPLPTGSQYCVKLEDDSGSPLSSYCFDVSFEDDSDIPETAAPFSMVAPYPPGLERVELTSQGKNGNPGAVLSSRAASAHPPTVTVTYPTASGLTLGGSHAITWSASDSDHDSLTYDILYSRDNGATWSGVAANLSGTSYTLDFSSLAGANGASGLIRVLALDGFYTALDSSDNPFTVANKPPSAAILSPSTGATFTGGPKIVLQGSGVNLEDGALGDGALSWASDRDGALGKGQELETALTPGLHTITLTVTDSKGLTNSASIQVTVVKTTTDGRMQYLPFVKK